MLSEKQSISKLEEKKHWLAMPILERPITIRLKFCKVGSLQYISHLDLQRTFNRVLVRACLPIWYTKGFNPHAKLVFSTPLSVGTQSVYEFLDVRFDRAISPEEVMDRINRELTHELYLTNAYVPEHDFSEIAWASYEMELVTADMSEELADRMETILKHSPLLMTKRTKSGEKEIDIVPLIRSASVCYDKEKGSLRATVLLRATSSEFLNPEMLVTAWKQQLGVLSGDPMKEWYTIVRTCVMNEDLTPFA